VRSAYRGQRLASDASFDCSRSDFHCSGSIRLRVALCRCSIRDGSKSRSSPQIWRAGAIGAEPTQWNQSARCNCSGSEAVRRCVCGVGEWSVCWWPDLQGTYQWQRSPDVPWTNVSAIVTQQGPSGFSGTVRASVYGRGVWERVIAREPCKISTCYAPVAVCLTCRTTGPAASSGKPFPTSSASATFAVRFTYRGELGPDAFIRAVPTSGAVDPPFFLTEVQRIKPGEDVALLSIYYSAAEAPSGLRTDSVRFEIFSRDANGKRRVSSNTAVTLPFDHFWTRPGARLLIFDARVHDMNENRSAVPLSIVVEGGQVIRGAPPLVAALHSGTRVVVTAPSDEAAYKQRTRLTAWTVNQVPTPKTTALPVILDHDTTVVAFYEPVPQVHIGKRWWMVDNSGRPHYHFRVGIGLAPFAPETPTWQILSQASARASSDADAERNVRFLRSRIVGELHSVRSRTTRRLQTRHSSDIVILKNHFLFQLKYCSRRTLVVRQNLGRDPKTGRFLVE